MIEVLHLLETKESKKQREPVETYKGNRVCSFHYQKFRVNSLIEKLERKK